MFLSWEVHELSSSAVEAGSGSDVPRVMDRLCRLPPLQEGQYAGLLMSSLRACGQCQAPGFSRGRAPEPRAPDGEEMAEPKVGWMAAAGQGPSAPHPVPAGAVGTAHAAQCLTGSAFAEPKATCVHVTGCLSPLPWASQSHILPLPPHLHTKTRSPTMTL